MHHATAADVPFAYLKLRFDQHYHISLGFQECDQHWQQETQRNEGHIYGEHGDALWELVGLQVAGVGALVNDDTRVGAQAPVQLAVAHVYGVDPKSAGLQETIGKATSRGPHVHGYTAMHREVKGRQGCRELLATTADVGA